MISWSENKDIAERKKEREEAMDLDKLTTEQINGFSAAEAGFHVSQVLREALAEKLPVTL